jgi:hypothetical protein
MALNYILNEAIFFCYGNYIPIEYVEVNNYELLAEKLTTIL